MAFTNIEHEFQNKLLNNQNFLNVLPPNNIFMDAWLTECHEPIVTTHLGNLTIKSTSKGLFGTIDLTSILDDNVVEQAAKDVYLLIFKALENYPTMVPIRFWNYMPAITRVVQDSVTRYQLFNAGRYNAFNAYYGESLLHTMPVPAASTVGTKDEKLKVEFLAINSTAKMIENREQVPAYQYSKNYGQIPPFFSRGVIYNHNKQHLLLTSGTASVVGEKSKYTDDLDQQLVQSVQNLGILGSQANLKKYSIDDLFELNDIAFLRIYYKHEHDRPALERAISKFFPSTCKVTFQHADICREELLVEIEALYVKPI